MDSVLRLISDHPEHEQLILLCALSAFWLKPQDPEAIPVLQRYQSRGYTPDSLRETALQLFLLAGFQVSLEAMFQIREVLGAALPALEEDLNASHWLARGKELQAAVYRENTEKLRANFNDASSELSLWTVIVGYGLVLSRPGLPGHWRELLEVVVLAIQGFPRQLHSHLRGALNLGASPQEIELALDVAAIFSNDSQGQSAWQMWQNIR